MLDPGPDEAGRDALAQDVRKRIEADGTLKHENTWGLRKMAYEIDQRNEADYRWFRFEAPTELLDGLNHNLRIADGVLRFRIFKVDADTPLLVPPASGAAGPGASRERPTEATPQAPAEPTVESAEPAAEATEPAAQAEDTAEAPPEPADSGADADE